MYSRAPSRVHCAGQAPYTVWGSGLAFCLPMPSQGQDLSEKAGNAHWPGTPRQKARPDPGFETGMFTLQPDSPTPLVTQIVDGLRRLIADGSLLTGAKIPSIRQFAKTHRVSVFTVVE